MRFHDVLNEVIDAAEADDIAAAAVVLVRRNGAICRAGYASNVGPAVSGAGIVRGPGPWRRNAHYLLGALQMLVLEIAAKLARPEVVYAPEEREAEDNQAEDLKATGRKP